MCHLHVISKSIIHNRSRPSSPMKPISLKLSRCNSKVAPWLCICSLIILIFPQRWFVPVDVWRWTQKLQPHFFSTGVWQSVSDHTVPKIDVSPRSQESIRVQGRKATVAEIKCLKRHSRVCRLLVAHTRTTFGFNLNKWISSFYPQEFITTKENNKIDIVILLRPVLLHSLDGTWKQLTMKIFILCNIYVQIYDNVCFTVLLVLTLTTFILLVIMW